MRVAGGASVGAGGCLRSQPCMRCPPVALALVAAVLPPRPLLRALADGEFTRDNYRGRGCSFPFGVLIVAAARSR